jgi:hypothetical protein
MDSSGWNMYVFRDGRRIVSGERLVFELRTRLGALAAEPCPPRDRILDALIAAGELECALADAAIHPAESPALIYESTRSIAESSPAQLTDALAEMLVSSAATDTEDRPANPQASAATTDSRAKVRELLRKLESLSTPARLQVSVHEGFAYYALHPLKIVDLLQALPVPRQAAVLGIRSIGVTLSAVLVAALKQRGCAAGRICVRPEGHPYERRLALSGQQKSLVERHRGGQFMVIDEGPGLSGSSFLAVAEALTEAGIERGDILLIGSRWPDPAQLRSPNAAERWNRFCFICLESSPYVPAGATIPIGGGQWRDELLTSDDLRPASWTQLEMSKFLSADRSLFYKFEGFGRFGGEIGKRARRLADAGLGPEYLGSDSGFGVYRMSPGRLLKPADLSPELLRHLARYCAFRLREFPADDSQPSALDEMASWNWSLEFGPSPTPEALQVEHRVFCDARMMPRKWLASPDGRLLKLDSVAHGDDHFFPGPCDIAWDLAGTIIEWKLDRPEQEYFLEEYRRASGDEASSRLPSYMKAYVAFRFGWSKMAAFASAGSPDEPLLWRDFERYRSCAASLSQAAGSAEAAKPQALSDEDDDSRPAQLKAA